MAEPFSRAVHELFLSTRKSLLETGTRNRLIHVNRKSQRSNSLDIINERSDDIFRLLVRSEKAMRFLATGKDTTEADAGPMLDEALSSYPDDEHFNDNQLETKLGPDGLAKRLLRLARDAKTAEEEQGVNVLYLAMGFLTWYEDETSDVKREAPLLLVPVELERNKKTSTYGVKVRDEDISTNLSLQSRLKGDFGIDLPDVLIDEHWTPSSYFAAVGEAVSGRSKWSIDADGMQLGFFSFAKLLMFRDLDPQTWPDQHLTSHPLTKGLLYEGFEQDSALFGRDENLDGRLSPLDLFHVLDADASQTKVIEEVRAGRNLVVQGPPGTGKSQTIANIIATAVKDGKRVLFLAEKMAALSVVHSRLVNVGLADICLELHSKSANKKAVLGAIGETLAAAEGGVVAASPGTRVLELRDRLNSATGELHREVGQSGESAFSALSRLVELSGSGVPPSTLDLTDLDNIDKDSATKIEEEIREYVAAITQAGSPRSHPFAGALRCDLQPPDQQRLGVELQQASLLSRELTDIIRHSADALHVPPEFTIASARGLRDQMERLTNPPIRDDKALGSFLSMDSSSRERELICHGVEWKKGLSELGKTFKEEAWLGDYTHLEQPLLAASRSFFARWGPSYRTASRELQELLSEKLPSSAADRSNLATRLREVTALRRQWETGGALLSERLGSTWQGEQTDFEKLHAAFNWAQGVLGGMFARNKPALTSLAMCPDEVGNLVSDLTSATKRFATSLQKIHEWLQFDLDRVGWRSTEHFPLEKFAEQCDVMANSMHRYEEWARLVRLRALLGAARLDSLLVRIEEQKVSGDAAVQEFTRARAEAIWKAALTRSPLLASLREMDRHAIVVEFQKAEKQRRKDCAALIRSNHLSAVPTGAQGEMAVIKHELAKKRAHKPIRKLMESAGDAIQRIKPVFLMSPISVAQFLKPGGAKFDLVVIDEASQVKPEDALGAIARTKQIVVVGDKKQLPPTTFFDHLSEDTVEDQEIDGNGPLAGAAPVSDMESILSLCEAKGIGSRMLSWHYRSREPSLIQVSNREFYSDNLVLPPSPTHRNQEEGLVFTRVRGAYDKGGRRDNRLEGEELVKRVIEHATASPDVSLGIATFSVAQRTLITELLELHRRKNPVLDGFLTEGGSEEVFVKNIENVQGDERDVILISVGYGPTEAGGRLMSMNFGPISTEGGERRLNVLFTRARLRCEVFCSFDPSDIDLGKVSKDGPRVFRRFLEFAKTGQLDEISSHGGEPDSPLEADVAREIKQLGFLVDHQVGTSGFLLDLGVRDPSRPGAYVLAVECDGATYHSALWARERDRLRQEVLEAKGWRFHRIWSTDWFYNRQQEIVRLQKALAQARKAAS